jgi:hypothetical protein
LTWERKQGEDPNRVSVEQFCQLIGGGSALPRGWYDEQLKNLHPTQPNRLEVCVCM